MLSCRDYQELRQVPRQVLPSVDELIDAAIPNDPKRAFFWKMGARGLAIAVTYAIERKGRQRGCSL